MSSSKDSGNSIQTFLRVRPSKKPSGYFATDELDAGTIVFLKPDNLKLDYINNTKQRYDFHFDGVLPMDASQEDVFNRVGSAAVRNALEGFNSTIFAYGQTGSGKTFTITGGPERYVDRGIIPRSISMIFGEFRNRTDVQLKAYVSYLELYNEAGYDLLDPSHETKALEDLPKVSMFEDENGSFHFKNLSMHPADSEEEALNLLFTGDTNRAIAETPMNMASSRSHCIFTIALEVRQLGSDVVRRSKLNLVDLAGSERVAKTNSSGSVLTEAMYINSSLFYLEMVIKALQEKATKGRQHIPYRNSMMTSVLRDSLGGNCKTIMVATINPEAAHTEESLSTCRFAQRVSTIKNRATVNEDLDPNAVIRRLKGEILTLREEITFLKGEAGEGEGLSPQSLADLERRCREYCDNPDPQSTINLGSMSLTRIKEAFAILKHMVTEARSSCGDAKERGSDKEEGSGELLRQIEDLKSCLVQRDTEIAILVNMVKKAKGAPSAPGELISEFDDQQQREAEKSSSLSLTSDTKKTAKTATSASDSADKYASEPKKDNIKAIEEQKAVKRFLFNIPPPDDVKIVEDIAACFEYFRQRSELRFAIEENKAILRDKMTEAQLLGEKANQSRSTINYLKTSIESIRRERALQSFSGDGANEEKLEDSPEEQTYRRAIEQEKIVYRDSFEKLRVLKPEIEYLRKILEKGRSNMQSQFDTWYNNLTARGFVAEEPVVEATRKVDDTINEDIAAFYKAKDALLKRREETK